MLEFTQHAYGFRTHVLILGLLAVCTVCHEANDLQSNSCTGEQSTAKRNSFNFRKFGNVTGLEDCVDICCRDDACELAILSRGFHCYGVSCDKPKLCHKILDKLLMEDERQLQRNPRNAGTTDFIRHTSQVTNPRCPKRFVPSFHVLLLPARTTREFYKFSQQSEDEGQCNTQCCRSRECLLSFIEDEECYGVTGLPADSNSTNSTRAPTLGLEIAIIDRNKEISRSLDDGDEDPDDIGSDDSDIKSSDTKLPRLRPTEVNSNLQTSQVGKIFSTTKKTIAKAKESVFSKRIPTMGPTKHEAQPTAMGHEQNLSNQSRTKHPKFPTTKDIKTKGVPFHFKGVASRRTPSGTPSVSKNRAFKIYSNNKSLTKHLSSTLAQRVSPSKGGKFTKIKPTVKVWKAAETRRGTQSIETGGKPKGKHYVKHLKLITRTTTAMKPSSKSSKVSRISDRGFEIGTKRLDTHHKGSTARLVGGTDEGNSRVDEGSLSGFDGISGDHRYSGEDREFSGHNAFSGVSGFDDISGDQGYFDKEHGFSVHDDFSGVGEDDVSGNHEYLNSSGGDSSKHSSDLMENAKVLRDDGSVEHHLSDADLSGSDIGVGGYAENSDESGKNGRKSEVGSTEEGDGPYKINHDVTKPKLYQGEDKNGNMARKKIDLIKDLEELGSDGDKSSVHSKQTSKKVVKVPRVIVSGIKKDPNTKKGKDKRMKSRKVHFDLKQSRKIKNQSSSKVSRKLRPESHDVKASNVRAKLNPKKRKNYGRTELLNNKTVRKERIQDGHKRSKMKSVDSTVKHTKPSDRNSSGRLMKTKDNVADIATKPFLFHGARNEGYKHNVIIKRNKVNRNAANSTASQIIPKAMSTGKVRKGKSISRRSKGKAKVIRTGDNATSHRPSTKGLTVNYQANQVKLNGKASLEKSMGKGYQAINQKKRKSLEFGGFQGGHRLQNKVKPLTDNNEKPTTLGNKKVGRTKTKSRLSNVNYKIKDTGDLMQYAHRKVSVRHKKTLKVIAGRNGSNVDGKTAQKVSSSIKVMAHKKVDKKYGTSPKDSLQNNVPHFHRKPHVAQKKQNSMHGRRAQILHLPNTTSEKGNRIKDSKGSIHQDLMLSSTVGSSSSKENRSFVSHITFSPHESINTFKTNISHVNISAKQRSNSNASDAKATFVGHFVNDSGGSNGIDFSVKSNEKHHKLSKKHRLTVDLDDLGDADFDIMMSNDIPHKELPKKSKGKDKKHASKSNKNYDNSRTEKKRKHNSHGNDEDDDAKGSFYKQKDQSEATSKGKLHRHHHHSHKEKDKDANEEDEEGTSREEDGHRNTERKSRHHHRIHDNANTVEQKDYEDENHHHSAHKGHLHHKKKESNEEDGEDNREARKHIKHHHVERDESDRSSDDQKMKHRRHHKHKDHDHIPKIKYDDNHWQGKVIPGRVKITYSKDHAKKRHYHHHKHKIQNDDDRSETRENHHNRKNSFKAHEMDSDSDEDTKNRKLQKHFKEKSNDNHEGDDDDENDEKQTSHRGNTHKKKEERVEEKTDVNYEVVKKGRHRASHDEDNGDDSDESSENKQEEKEDDSDEVEDNDKVNEEDKDNAHDHSDGSERKKNNRVVLGDDSEDEDEDEAKQTEESHDADGHWNKHNYYEQEHASNEEEYHKNRNRKEYHKPHFYHKHWESRHKHHESHFESKASDDDNSDHFGVEAENNLKHDRRNFRKSKIYHRERKKEWREYHEAEGENEETNNDNHERQFQRSHKQYHYHHKRPEWKNDKTIEEYREHNEQKEAYERDPLRNNEDDNGRNLEHIDEHIPDYQKEREGVEEIPSRDRIEERRPNDESGEDKHKKHHHEKFHHFPEDDGVVWKNKEDFEGNKYENGDVPYRREQAHNHRLMDEDKKPYEDNRDHEVHYDHGSKHKPRHWKKWHRKNHHHFYEKDQPDFEGTGGPFDSSASMRVYNADNDDDDQYYGGEGNQEYQGRNHYKHKHRKHRQSYEFWSNGNQNPYYYDYNYHNSRAPYGYYKPRSKFSSYSEWRREHYGDYDRWRPKPSRWYPHNEHWNRKSSWPASQDNKPVDFQWNKFYNNNGMPPIPTPYPEDPSNRWRPTNPQWKPPDQTQNSFGKNNWSSDQYPTQGHAGGEYQNQKQYNDWSKNGPPLHLKQGSYGPQRNPSAPGLQPWRNINATKQGAGQQSTGVQSQYIPPAQQNSNKVFNQTKFHPTNRPKYPAGSSSQVSGPTNINQIKKIMDKLNTPPSTSGVRPGKAAPTVKQDILHNATTNKDGVPKTNLTTTDQLKDRNRLNGFFNAEKNGKKKSEILRPANRSEDRQAEKNTSSQGNTSQHASLTPQTTRTPPKPPSNQVTNKTTGDHTNPQQAAGNRTNKPTAPTLKSSTTTAKPTTQTTTEHTPAAAPNFGDVSQSDDSSETGKKHRKHRAPICMAGKTTDDVTLLRGKKAGNFTNIGDVGDFEMCIKRCCQTKTCDLAFKSAETCFLVNCFDKDSCKTTESLDDIFSPRMCFVKRHLSDEEKDDQDQDGNDEWDDKVSPSGIREVCDMEKALGILWKKTIAGRFSAHPCPRGAKGFVRRRCEADSRWMPPDFSDCVSNGYQDLYDKSRKLAAGADPSPLIRELSQLTTQNIDNSLIFGGDLNRATDIMAAIVQHNGQTEFLEMTKEDVENFVRASSNLLDMTNQQEWFNIQKNKPGSADVLRAMEMFALQAARRLSREDMAEPTITNNIVIKMDRKSAGDDGLTFPDFANPRVNRWDARHDVIALPSSVFAQTTKDVSVATISFKSLPYLLPDSNVSTGLGPNSKVMSTVLHPHPQGKITPPVTIVLSHIKRKRGNPKCVFWDYALSPHRGGAWSSRGCWLAYNNHTHSICQCSHLSNFAVLMDLSSDEVSQKEQKRERTMALMWIGIPVLIVGVIGGLYMSFSWNRKSGMSSSVTRPPVALNEKTGLLGQRVVTSQVREEFPPSPTRDLYRALSPGYSPTGDLEWQDEFDFEVEPGDQGFKQMLLPKLQMLQNHLINEFYDSEKMETKRKKLLETTIKQKPQITIISPVQPPSDQSNHSQNAKSQSMAIGPVQCERTPTRQTIQPKSQITTDHVRRSQTFKTTRRQSEHPARKLRVRFADESPPGRNLTDEDKERFKRLQKMERRVFAQHISRWTASSHLNLSE